MATKLADIAQKAGVSQATISRVINDKPGVSNDTRRLVLDTMKELGLARMTAGRTEARLVALFTPDLLNPIFPMYVTEITALLAQQRLLPILCEYSPLRISEEAFFDLLQDQSLAGAMFLAGSFDTEGADHSRYQALADRGIPAVYFNAAAHDADGLYVATDDRAATLMALKHLTSLGHERIGLLLGDRSHFPSMIKYRTAMEFFAEHHIDHGEELTLWNMYGVDAGQSSALRLIEQDVTAILCANDQLAIGATVAARASGLRVPEDLSIIGYDDSRAMNYTNPPLTTVRQPVTRICAAAVQGLMTMMSNPTAGADRSQLLFAPELVVRETTGRCKDRTHR